MMINNHQNQEVAELELVTYNNTQNDSESFTEEVAMVSNEIQYELLKISQQKEEVLQKYVCCFEIISILLLCYCLQEMVVFRLPYNKV